MHVQETYKKLQQVYSTETAKAFVGLLFHGAVYPQEIQMANSFEQLLQEVSPQFFIRPKSDSVFQPVVNIAISCTHNETVFLAFDALALSTILNWALGMTDAPSIPTTLSPLIKQLISPVLKKTILRLTRKKNIKSICFTQENPLKANVFSILKAEKHCGLISISFQKKQKVSISALKNITVETTVQAPIKTVRLGEVKSWKKGTELIFNANNKSLTGNLRIHDKILSPLAVSLENFTCQLIGKGE